MIETCVCVCVCVFDHLVMIYGWNTQRNVDVENTIGGSPRHSGGSQCTSRGEYQYYYLASEKTEFRSEYPNHSSSHVPIKPDYMSLNPFKCI